MDLDPCTRPAPEAADCPVLELRQYRLHPGRREALIRLFEQRFVEPQEAVGARVVGPFRDLDDPVRFGWLRGFAGMDERRQALQAFYGGPVWAAHRDAANATMVDSDDVRLLRPAWTGAGLAAPSARRAGPAADSAVPTPGVLELLVAPLRAPAAPALLRTLQCELQPALARSGVLAQGWYVTEPARNDYPRLPVREGEPVLAALALWPDAPAAPRSLFTQAAALLHGLSAGPLEQRRWQPCARSALHA